MKEKIVFVTPEIAIIPDLHTYSGGLGVVSGSFSLSARKFGLPVVFISILPRQGLYEQGLDTYGMTISYKQYFYDWALEDAGLVPISVCGSPTYVRVWRLVAEKFNSAEVLFLDCDIPENDELSRKNSLQLYGGSFHSGSTMERKAAYSDVLAKGSIAALRHLGYSVKLYHINESYGAFLPLMLLLEKLKEGIPLKAALDFVRACTVFTTHTSLDAGNPKYNTDMVAKMTGVHDINLLNALGGDPFNMAVAAARLSSRTNSVSQSHLSVLENSWQLLFTGTELVSVTNGVSSDFWQSPEFRNIKNAKELAKVKARSKTSGIKYLQEKFGICLNPDAPILVWARRFAEYKRPTLLFHDLGWLRNHFERSGLQVILSGKPHPDDKPMIEAWNWIYRIAKELPHLFILPEYEPLEMGRILRCTADIWLNTPRPRLEACGTSGMSANMNGTLQVSSRDGWVLESDPQQVFLFGGEVSNNDNMDAEDMRKVLDCALNIFSNKPEVWYEMALQAKYEAEERWTSDRMLRDYYSILYRLDLDSDCT